MTRLLEGYTVLDRIREVKEKKKGFRLTFVYKINYEMLSGNLIIT